MCPRGLSLICRRPIGRSDVTSLLMYPKLLAIIVFSALMGVMVLGFRQRRLETMHEMTRLHQSVDDMRREMWRLQGRIAEDCQPARLREAIEATGLELEPMTPLDAGTGPLHMIEAFDVREQGFDD